MEPGWQRDDVSGPGFQQHGVPPVVVIVVIVVGGGGGVLGVTGRPTAFGWDGVRGLRT